MKQRQRGETPRHTPEYQQKWDVRAGPSQMDAHDERHRHPQKNAEEREPKVLQTDGLVVCATEAAQKKAVPWSFLVIRAAVVSAHACLQQTSAFQRLTTSY